MKQKSAKLKKLERSRYSILTNDLDHCYICGKSPVDIHEIYGGANRKVSMENGFCMPLCRKHHEIATNSTTVSLAFKQTCQQTFEIEHSREEFMNLIGKNYRE